MNPVNREAMVPIAMTLLDRAMLGRRGAGAELTGCMPVVFAWARDTRVPRLPAARARVVERTTAEKPGPNAGLTAAPAGRFVAVIAARRY
jgi:hypothetical protein